jgi:hypothetical protein
VQGRFNLEIEAVTGERQGVRAMPGLGETKAVGLSVGMVKAGQAAVFDLFEEFCEGFAHT